MTAPVPVITPAAGIQLPKTRADWQQLFHAVTLALVPLLVLAHIGTHDQVTQWSAVILAAVDAILSWSNSPDPTRRVIYAVGGLVQTAALSFGLANQDAVIAWVGAGTTALNSILAQFYTPTSGLEAAGRRPADG